MPGLMPDPSPGGEEPVPGAPGRPGFAWLPGSADTGPVPAALFAGGPAGGGPAGGGPAGGGSPGGEPGPDAGLPRGLDWQALLGALAAAGYWGRDGRGPRGGPG